MNGRDERSTTGEAASDCEVVRRDCLIAVSGQADLDSCAQVPHPVDPGAQVAAVVGRIRERLDRVGANLSDLAKLVVFHVPGPGCREWEMRGLLARALGPDVLTTLTMVPLPRLVAPGLLIAVDAYAVRGAAGQRIERASLEVPGLASLPEPFCHGLRCGEFIFTGGQSALDERGEVLFAGDLPSQNRYALDGVAAVLDGLGADPGDIVKFNTWRAPPALATGVPPRCAGSLRFPGRRTTRRYGDHDPRIDGAGTADPDGRLGDALDRRRTIAAPGPET